MATSNDALPANCAEPMQMDNYDGESSPKRPRLAENQQTSPAATSAVVPNRQKTLCSKDRSHKDAGSSSNEAQSRTADPMTGPLRGTPLRKAATTRVCEMDNPSLMKSGGTVAIAAWTWLWTLTQGPFLNQWLLVTNAIDLGVERCHLDSAFAATTGDAQNLEMYWS
eukprot:3941990-Amphidinium_carterae.2